MMEFLERSFMLDGTGWIVLIMLVGAGYTLLSQMLGEQLPALLGTPVLVLGAVFGNQAMASIDIEMVSASDKVMNMVVGMAGGMMVGGVLVVLMLWGLNAMFTR